MVIDWLKKLVRGYFRWLNKETEVVEADNGWFVVSTPFLGAFNNTIEIYARREDGKILLSDDGEVLRNLELRGCDVLRDARRLKFVEAVLLNHGARLDRENGELLAESRESDFPQKIHTLISAMLEINGMVAVVRVPASEGAKSQDLEELQGRKYLNIINERVGNFLPEFRDDSNVPEKIADKPVRGIVVRNDSPFTSVAPFKNRDERRILEVKRENRSPPLAA